MIYYSRIKTLFTIHNLQYQGNFDKSTMELLGVPYYCYENGNVEFYGNVSYMKMGLMYADRISTVSQTYAKEIQTWQYGYGMDGILKSRKNVLSGIINGIDYVMNGKQTAITGKTGSGTERCAHHWHDYQTGRPERSGYSFLCI